LIVKKYILIRTDLEKRKILCLLFDVVMRILIDKALKHIDMI